MIIHLLFNSGLICHIEFLQLFFSEELVLLIYWCYFSKKIENFKQTAFSGDKEEKNRIEDILTSMFTRFTTKCLEIFLIVIKLFFIEESDIPELHFSDYFVFVIKWEIIVYFLQ